MHVHKQYREREKKTTQQKELYDEIFRMDEHRQTVIYTEDEEPNDGIHERETRSTNTANTQSMHSGYDSTNRSKYHPKTSNKSTIEFFA